MLLLGAKFEKVQSADNEIELIYISEFYIVSKNFRT